MLLEELMILNNLCKITQQISGRTGTRILFFFVYYTISTYSVKLLDLDFHTCLVTYKW